MKCAAHTREQVEGTLTPLGAQFDLVPEHGYSGTQSVKRKPKKNLYISGAQKTNFSDFQEWREGLWGCGEHQRLHRS